MQTRTLHDVAKAAKVSPSTVSRILNGTAVVSPDKRKSVEEAIARLGYRPNFMAQALAKGRSMLVGVVTQSISSPFYGESFVGIETGLHQSGYHPMFISSHWQVQEERAVIEILTARRADALIVMGGNLEDSFLRRTAGIMPLVTVGRTVAGLEWQSVQINQIEGAKMGMRHLLELGHRRIAHIAGPSSHRDAGERLNAYKQALTEYSIEFDPSLVVEGNYQEQGGLLATEQLLSRHSNITAIFCANDQTAYGARLALYRRGFRVPEDISLLGFDGLFSSSFTTPPLTTVRQPGEEMGNAAAKMILSLLEGKTPSQIAIVPTLMVRESTSRLRFS
jgi:LacI family transcriptional regulator